MADGEITISELELSEELLADMVIPVETSTDTKSATLQQLKSWLGTSLPIGSFFSSVGKIDDPRFTLLDGKTLSATGTYAEFYLKAVEKVQAGKWQSCTEEEFNQEVAQYGQCLKFVISNDYVRIPKVGNKLYTSGFNASDVQVAGNGMTLGFTNGTQAGGLGQDSNNDLGGYTGLLGKPVGTGRSGTKISQSNVSWGITTDPTQSGIIAKTSNLNLNNTTNIYYYMVVSTEGQTEPVDIDINQVYEDMELKANKNFTNIDNEGKRTASGWGMPSSRYTDLTLGGSGSRYTAPANGWVYIAKTATGAGQYLDLTNANSVGVVGYQVRSHYNNDVVKCSIPVKKNDNFDVSYSVGGSLISFRFVYAEGEN